MSIKPRIQIIDFLRGLSCLGILLFHVRIDLWIGWIRITSYPDEYSAFDHLIKWLSVPAPFLGYSILLFFIISGFCIHFPNQGIISNPNWKSYFLRRFFRIYPPYIIAIIFSAVISFVCSKLWLDSTWNLERIFRVVTLSQNYSPNNGQFLCNPSLWTIPLEIEFYLLYPLAFFIFSRLRSISVLLLTLSLSTVSVYLIEYGFAWISYTALFFWPVWLLGAKVAEFYNRKISIKTMSNIKILLILITSLGVSLYSRYVFTEWWVQYVTWTFFYLVFFVYCVFNASKIHSMIGYKLFNVISWIGKISFSLYLIHYPLFKLIGYFHVEIFGSKPSNFLITLIYIFPVIFIAWLFFIFIENPIHQWSKKFRYN